MGHRALIGKTKLPNGKIELFYSHWGALEAHEAQNKIQEPKEIEKIGEVDTEEEFGKKVNYLHHEAVWLDGQCYCPIWCFPSGSVDVKNWITDGQGVLIKCNTGKEFSNARELMDSVDLIDQLTDFSTKNKIKLMINFIEGRSCSGDIPDFSPLSCTYESMKDLIKKLKQEAVK